MSGDGSCRRMAVAMEPSAKRREAEPAIDRFSRFWKDVLEADFRDRKLFWTLVVGGGTALVAAIRNLDPLFWVVLGLGAGVFVFLVWEALQQRGKSLPLIGVLGVLVVLLALGLAVEPRGQPENPTADETGTPENAATRVIQDASPTSAPAVSARKIERPPASTTPPNAEPVINLRRIELEMIPNVPEGSRSIEDAFEAIRSKRMLTRPLEGNSGKVMRDQLSGTYHHMLASRFDRSNLSFADAVYDGPSQRLNTRRHYYEFHKISEMEVHMVVFVDHQTAATIARLDGSPKPNVTIYPTRSTTKTTLISIPVERVFESEFVVRDVDGDGMFSYDVTLR